VLNLIVEKRICGIDTGLTDDAWLVGCLHMGGGGRRDDFAQHAGLFGQLVEHVGKDNMFGLGDVLDTTQQHGSARIERAYPVLSHAITKGVRGNHDLKWLGFPESLTVGRVRLVHGFQADICNSTYAWVGRLLTRLSGMLEWLLWRHADNPESWWGQRCADLNDVQFCKWEARRLKPWMDREFKSAGADCLILANAHTHRAMLHRRAIDGRIIANAGTWASDHWPPTAIHVEPDAISLVRVAA